MRQFHYYDLQTGLLHPRVLSGGVADQAQMRFTVERNRPAGHGIIEGRYDQHCQRVDVATGAIIDYQPPAPSAEHVWNAEAKRWHLHPDAQAKRDAKAAAQVRREALIHTVQPHLVRALLLNPNDATARRELARIDAEMTSLRKILGGAP